ncbi:RluA family pseudouridine synthase [Novosphingobium sp.]|uniref:RluA family pseudouridine synthase n=1 Tax=Novosphingobium sp. TaxID=1874826 RepID=UPI0031D0FAB0
MTKDNTKTPRQHQSADTVRQFTVGPDDNDIRLDRWFKRHLPQVGFATISRWARTGQIRVDGKRSAPEDRLTTGQVLRVPPGDTHAPGAGTGKGAKARKPLTDAQLEMADRIVLHRDPSAIVINKPPGLATQGGSGTFEHVDGLLDAYAGGGYGDNKNAPRPRLVHRLDKDTSGALLVAATPGSAAYFSRRFSSRQATKIYWALVIGVPSIDEGLIDLPLAKQPGTGGEKMMVDHSEQGQPSKSRYRVIDRAGNSACWMELQPLTGRTHQLRVHLAAIGHPIVGDGKYGGKDAFLSGSISRKMHLHARRIIIDHPDGTPLDVTAPLPEHFAASLAQLGFNEDDGEFIPDPTGELTRDEEKSIAKAHAKQYRKERRGERRGRAETGRARTDAKPRKAVPGKARPGGVKIAKGKGVTGPKAAAAKPASAPRSGPSRPAGGKPAAPRKPSAPRGGPKSR